MQYAIAIHYYTAAFVPLQDAIHHLFYPAVAILGDPVPELETQLFDLPAHAGSLEISDPVESAAASVALLSSQQGSAVLQTASYLWTYRLDFV